MPDKGNPQAEVGNRKCRELFRDCRPHNPSNSWRRGFTLLEVLIAIAVLVLAISAILPLFAVGASAHKRGMDQAHLAWIAPRIAADLQEDLYETSPKDIRDGAWKEYGQTYTYDATFTRLAGSGQGDPTANAAFLLTVQVKWKETGDVRSETFKTLVLRKFPR